MKTYRSAIPAESPENVFVLKNQFVLITLLEFRKTCMKKKSFTKTIVEQAQQSEKFIMRLKRTNYI